jgi:4-amino-4-deoxy-L-arabinose transferase-like glycosyltransferase
MIALLLASGALVIAAVLFAALLPPRGAVAFALAVALLAQAMVVLTVGAAGLLIRDLSPLTLLLGATLWVLAAAALARRRPEARRTWAARARRSGRAIRSVLADPPVAIAGVLVLGTLAWRTFLALRLPVVDYDGWSYHLVFADVWLQHNALTLVPQRLWSAGNPANTEILTTWLMAFSRNDSLAGFTSIVPIPAAIAATTGLARSLRVSRGRALLAGLLFGMTPALVTLSGTSYVDAAAVAFTASAWWLGVRVVRGETDRAGVLLLGLAAGLALGTKGTNILLVTPILTAAGLVLARDFVDRIRAGRPIREVVERLALLTVPVVVFGISWFLKNVIVYGNPLYPFAVGPFPGPTSFTDFAFVPPQLEGKGWLGKLASSWTADWHLTRYAYNVRPGGFGRAWPMILPFAVAGAVVVGRRRDLVPVALVVAPVAVTLLIMPMPWYARYTLFVPAIALPLALLAIDALRPWLRVIAGLALVGVAAISLTLANARPNIDIHAGDPPHLLSVGHYVSFLLDPNDARRANVSLRAECAGFGVIPPGSIVAPGGFNLLHGVVGPNLDRILGDPLGPASDPATLAGAMQKTGATWLVTSTGGRPDSIAASAPDRFKSFGEICQGARLWQLQPAP